MFYTLARQTPFINTSSIDTLRVVSEKDLGVIINEKCTPNKQVSAAALKGNQVLGQLLRIFTTRDGKKFMKLFIQQVCPILEYCSQVWSH